MNVQQVPPSFPPAPYIRIWDLFPLSLCQDECVLREWWKKEKIGEEKTLHGITLYEPFILIFKVFDPFSKHLILSKV